LPYSSIAYYAAHDQDDRGKASLRRVNGKVEGYDVDAEYAIIKNTILEERKELDALGVNHKSTRQLLQSYIECFKGKNALRTLGATLPICSQQLTGLSFLNTYASLFFRQSGFTNAFLITTILSIPPLLLILTLLTCVYSDHRPFNIDMPHCPHRQIWTSKSCSDICYSLHCDYARCRYPWLRAQNYRFEELSHLRRLRVVVLQRCAYVFELGPLQFLNSLLI
jgi:hypothetical protein